jgi:EmrB/QacA subfamily drug resistance transporter
MVVLDATIVNVALPSIQKDLGLSEANLQWIINAYTLVFGGFLLLGGRAGDLLGRKRLFLIGLVIFTTASLLNGLATTSGMLIGFRALQGLGAALISPAALSIISTTFAEGKERARALGVWAAIAIGGSAFGLVLGGWLTQSFSWRWIFFVNVPVGIFAFLAAMRIVPESKDEHAHQGYDLGGAVTVTGGLMVLVYAIVTGHQHGWASATTLGGFLAAAVLLGAFVLFELRAKEPLVRLSIFRVRSLLTANLAMFLAFSGMFAMFYFNTLYVQKVLGFGPLEAGLCFLPFTGGIMISAGVASSLAPRIGVRPVAAVGMLLSIAGMLLFARMPLDGSYPVDVLPGMIISALGMGAIFMPLTLMATTGLEDEDQGLASGLFNTSQQVGGALGLAILTTIAASQEHGNPFSPPEVVHGGHYGFAGAACFVAGGLVVMLALLRKHHVARIQASAAEAEPVPVS